MCTGKSDCKCDDCKSKTHPKWCCCGACVRSGNNQKPLSAPDDHPTWCRCGKCVGK